MTQASTNATFVNGKTSSVTGGAAGTPQQLLVEYLATDPTDLATTSPRIWVNTTTGILKYTYNVAGAPVKTVTAT